MTGPRTDDALLYFATICYLLRQSILAIPEATQDVGVVDIPHLEADEHLVVDFREKLDTALITSSRSHHACPVAGVLAGQPWILHLHAPVPLRILVVGHDADDQSRRHRHNSLIFTR